MQIIERLANYFKADQNSWFLLVLVSMFVVVIIQSVYHLLYTRIQKKSQLQTWPSKIFLIVSFTLAFFSVFLNKNAIGWYYYLIFSFILTGASFGIFLMNINYVPIKEQIKEIKKNK